jgi:transposase
MIIASERDEYRRLRWLGQMLRLDPGKLVFVDERGFHLAMTPDYARAPKGERAYAQVARNRGENTSFLAALSLNGLQAPMLLQGSMDSVAFEAYVDQVLAPTLVPGQLAGRDNHRIHKGDRVAELLGARGCSLLFLPPYSPDFNPIEEAFSKVKRFVKSCYAHTRDALERAVAAALKTISLEDILGWFEHCGYNPRYQ